MNYFPLIIFGLAPSIIWLLFYLRKDVHPESNRMVLRIFLYGMLAAIPAALLELGIAKELNKLDIPPFLISVFYIFVGIALVEEVLKYLVVKGKVLANPELDEPLDVMLYMIISALGFAALENILVLLPLSSPFYFFEALSVSILRFIGATFLHTLCSGTLGFFLALSFFETKNRIKLFATGILIATLLHGLYNFSIMKIETSIMVKNGLTTIIDLESFIFSIIVLIAILIGQAIFVFWGFKKLEKLASVCKIK